MRTEISDITRQRVAVRETRLPAARAEQPDTWQASLDEPRVADSLARVWACSEFVATSCLRSPALLSDLIADGHLFQRASDDWIAREIEARVGGDSEAELMEAL